ncbi:MAG: hypothetical protein ISS82_05950 [Nanoarchaeota archaeon]|nr:hypothetical protein [Nanoarchaeota archaeon]
MVNGVDIKCRNCHKKFWVEIKLSFGAMESRNMMGLLECLLNEVRLYFRCPYCKQDTIVGVKFFSDKLPEMTQIVDNPNYIG